MDTQKMQTERCGAATASYQDSDTFDLADIILAVRVGYESLGDTGWINDHGWNDVRWSEILADSEQADALSSETCVADMPTLPRGYVAMTVRHSDDDPGNAGTSETNAWWVTYLFRRIGRTKQAKLQRASPELPYKEQRRREA